MLNWNKKREELTEYQNAKDHMAIFPVLFVAYTLRQSWVIYPYVRAVISLLTIQHFGIHSLII